MNTDRLEIVAGKIVARLGQPSATQDRFNDLMERVDHERALADALRQVLDVHIPAHRQAVREVTLQNRQLACNMVLLLDERIQAADEPNGLTASQKRQAIHMVLTLCQQVLQTDSATDSRLHLDPALQAVQTVWARYHDAEQSEEERQQAQEQTREMLESYLGAGFAKGRKFDNEEDMLRAAAEFAHQRQQAQKAKREARKQAKRVAKRDAKRQAQHAAHKANGSDATDTPAQPAELDANQALRTLYRQLASSLHPDREPDEALRERKTALMSTVNTAYEAKDLNTLLRIQLDAQVLDASKAATLTEAKLRSMCDLLAAQVKTLQAENQRIRDGLQYEFGYPAAMGYDETRFVQTLQTALNALRSDMQQLRADWAQVQDDKGLKTWLKEQVRLSKERARSAQSPD